MHTLRALLLITVGVGAGCETKPKTTPVPAPPTVAAQTTASSATNAAASTDEGSSAHGGLRQALLDIGCPEDKLLEKGCAELAPRIRQGGKKGLAPCPAEHVLDVSCSVYPIGELKGTATGRFPPYPIRARFGRFTPSGNDGWLLFLDGGGASRADGQHKMYVAEHADDGWKIVTEATTHMNDSVDCWVLKSADDRSHVLCEIASGQQDCNDTRIESVGLIPMEIKNWPFANKECADRKFEDFMVTDLDDDGDDDATVKIDGVSWQIIQDEKSFEAKAL